MAKIAFIGAGLAVLTRNLVGDELLDAHGDLVRPVRSEAILER